MSEYVHTIVRFAEAHAALVYVLAFATTYLEAIAVIGLLVPGSSIVVTLGALVPSGAVGFWWLCLWSVVGAVAGDGSSYWIGRRFSDRVGGWWPLRNHPEVLAGGQRFFAAHGGKSIFFARFVAPVRGAVPLVAGMARMTPNRFLVANVISALGWAPAHILLGVLIGAGLTLTGAVATRLLVLVVVLAVVLWLAAKATALALRRGRVLLAVAQRRLDGWARRREGWLARQVLALLDPGRGEARPLALFGLVLTAAAWLFFGVLEDVVSGDPLVRADTVIYNLLQGLRTRAADHVMVAITELGGAPVVGAVAGTVLLWLLWRRAWHAAAYWFAAIGGASLIGLAIKAALHRPRPVPLFAGWDAFSFPSGHAITSAAMYGFLAVLLARNARPAWQALSAVTVVVLVALIGFSRLYLGAHWFSDVVGGIAFGVAWMALLAIAYVRHDPPRLRPLPLAAVAIVTFVGVGGVEVVRKMPLDLQRYAVRQTEQTTTAAAWWRDGWRKVALYRIDLIGERKEPLVLQWAGRLKDLQARLATGGWRLPPPWSLTTAQRWVGPVAHPLRLPVLPHLHEGRDAALTLIHADNGAGHAATRWVLRVWSAGTRLTVPGAAPQSLWLGAITLQHFRGTFAPFDLGFETAPPAVPWPLLEQALSSARTVLRTDSQAGVRVLLAHDPAFKESSRALPGAATLPGVGAAHSPPPAPPAAPPAG